MLLNFSSKYQKEIALGFISMLLVSGIGSLKAESLLYSGSDNHVTLGYTRAVNIASENNLLTREIVKQSEEIINSTPIDRGFGEKKYGSDKGNSSLQSTARSANEGQVKATSNPLKLNIGGPGQPEMSSFKSIGADNMVSPFTGDFSYNLPLFDVGGYPINMFYNSGITMDQDASWVGLGWNINPGTIMRNMRGLPDDFNGQDFITKKQGFKADKTYGISLGAGAKAAGFPLGIDVSGGFSYNNKLGLALEAGIHPSLSISKQAGGDKTVGLSYGASLNFSSRNGGSITPSISASFTKNDANNGSRTASIGVNYTYSSRAGITGMHLDAGLSKSKQIAESDKSIPYQVTSVSGSIATLSSGISFVYPTVVPSIKTIFTRRNLNLSLSVGGEFYGLNAHGRINGFYVENKIAKEDQVTTHPAYGMLYYQKANNDPKALLDFNRANDVMYTPASPAIAMPVYTYDVFSINGEGTGGSFRAYRGDLGNMRDAYTSTKDDSKNIALDLGFGNVVHGGAEFSFAFTPSVAQEWGVGNLAKSVFKFQENKKDFQAVYFKNPGEKTIPDANFQTNIGGENLVRLKLGNIASGTPTLLPTLVAYDGNKNKIAEPQLTASNVIRQARDKRTQVITFLTGIEAARAGFDKMISSYGDPWDTTKVIFSTCGSSDIKKIDRRSLPSASPIRSIIKDTYRQDHHISEIDVLGTDGKKYVYGVPVYNIEQRDVSFSITGAGASNGLVPYQSGTDDEIGNPNGRDGFMEQQTTPAYTHSFLLSALLSPNYVDVKNDGITEDDMGDAIKFNYTRYGQQFQWRTPMKNASYSTGLETDEKDDKAHYVYGKREMWHLYSIESKNMVARFYVKNDRKDCREVMSSAGGINNNWGMQRLFKISLFSKADLLKNTNARPIKTVRFFQSYKLCKNTDGNGSSVLGYGKLTLDSIWISYNGHDKKPKSRYVFYYPDQPTGNPDYNYVTNDMWGNYKPEAEVINNTSVNTNPGNLRNKDYPYVIQDKEKADRYSSAWTMNKILLPSGGFIKVDYESDDYAYVQDKRAASMIQVLGFGNPAIPETNNDNISPNLYYKTVVNNKTIYKNNEYVYLLLPQPITLTSSSAADNKVLAHRYFEDVKQLYMKLSVIMPPISGLPGEELVPVYADIKSFGLVRTNAAGTSSIAYVQVKPLEEGSTPMTQQVLQFLKQQLPGKAYKGYDLSEEGGVKSVVLGMAGLISAISGLAIGEDNVIKAAGKCKVIVPERSFAKLANPNYNKLGGGLRVKRVEIDDNWDKMTHQFKAVYGQEYKYTKTALINNKQETISSGVASWEPSVGSDENAHREIMRFNNHNKGGPYDYGAIEMPLGEPFYPSPMVGYSRIEILSIHRDTVKNLPVKEVTEFYTTRDFPFKSSCTQLTDPEANVKYEPKPIMELLKLDLKRAITQSQGFLVDMNDMNGKERKKSTYSAEDPVNPVSYTENFYNIEKTSNDAYSFKHGFETIARPDGKIANSIIGRDIELMTDFREHSTITTTTNINLNLDFFVLGIFPVPLNNILQPTISEGMTYRSASVLKIVNHYGVLDSVVVSDKGSVVSTKNLVFDAETGNPLLTRTNNEHQKPVYSFSYPAHWAYQGMGPAYKNIDLTFSGLTFKHGILVTPLSAQDKDLFESGDEIYAFSVSRLGPLGSYPCDGTDPCVQVRLPKNNANKIWAVYTGKVGSATPQMVFMDADGNPYTAENVSVRVIRSGYRNMLDQSVGAITCMKNPIRKNADNSKEIVFKDNISDADIIQSSAVTFKDHWRVDNSFYKYESTDLVTNYATIKRMDFPMAAAAKMRGKIYGDYRGHQGYVAQLDELEINPLSLSARMVSKNTDYSMAYDSWVNFDIRSRISGNDLGNPSAVVTGAKLSLFAHTSQNYMPSINVDLGFNHDGYRANASTINHTGAWSHRKTVKKNTNEVGIWPMLAPWPSSDQQWEQYYVDQDLSLHDWANIATIGETDDQSSLNYTTGVSLIRDTRISISQAIAQTMINNARTPGNNITTGFRLGQLRSSPYEEVVERNKDRSQCFTGSPANLPTHSMMNTPLLSVYYYICGETGTVPNTDNDPEVNKWVVCDQSYQTFTECRSKFKRKAINPYVEGIFGNWRMDMAYVYNGNRKERTVTNSDLSNSVDTRTAGSIEEYKDFWSFNKTAPSTTEFFLNRNDPAEWQWKSAITQYNRKGYEIENTDPLKRYNAGLYGYNQQLPIAVVNNSRVRESMFDGFEDYGYQSAFDCITCRPRRSFNFNTAIDNLLDPTQKHTGSYSLRVDGGQQVVLNAPVTSEAVANGGCTTRIRVDSTSYTETIVNSQGTGLVGRYLKYKYKGKSKKMFQEAQTHFATINTDGNALVRNDLQVNLGVPPGALEPPFALECDPEHFPRCTLTRWGHFITRWDGYIVPEQSGTYQFRSFNNDRVRVSINGQPVISNAWEADRLVLIGYGTAILTKGQPYHIVVDYVDTHAGGQCNLLWRQPCSSSADFELVPTRVLYPTLAAAQNPNLVTTVTQWCTKLDTVNVYDNALTDTFSLIQKEHDETKMLLSAWVKETANDCKCSTYVKNAITINLAGGGTPVNMIPTGNIIEGWQRYEGVFTIPSLQQATITEINIALVNGYAQGGSPVFFDDLRVCPFNANMKSFVYHPSNLRLMAELDENNYASFYEYDDDGTLTRVKKETVKGIKTIKETRSATQKEIYE